MVMVKNKCVWHEYIVYPITRDETSVTSPKKDALELLRSTEKPGLGGWYWLGRRLLFLHCFNVTFLKDPVILMQAS